MLPYYPFSTHEKRQLISEKPRKQKYIRPIMNADDVDKRSKDERVKSKIRRKSIIHFLAFRLHNPATISLTLRSCSLICSAVCPRAFPRLSSCIRAPPAAASCPGLLWCCSSTISLPLTRSGFGSTLITPSIIRPPPSRSLLIARTVSMALCRVRRALKFFLIVGSKSWLGLSSSSRS